MSIRPEPIDANVIVNSEALMSYSEGEKVSAKSFIIRVPCSEILRMTCNSSDLRSKTNISSLDIPLLNESYLDFSVLFDNVRGLVKKSKYNPNIEVTLKENPKKFFMYNNGITLIADSIVSELLPAGKRMQLSIKNFQVVNGGQTLRTIHDFNKKNSSNFKCYLLEAEVLVRIFMPGNNQSEAHKIAEYTNSQNPIKSVDLKSLSSEQIEIERYLDEHDIAYARKTGDTGRDEEKEYRHVINMESLGKLLKAMSGFPDKATNSLKDIFEGSYDKFFVENLDLSKLPSLIDKYFNIVKLYKDHKISGNQLKFYYVVYFSETYKSVPTLDIVNLLEKSIKHYVSKNEEMTPIKALGSVSFKKEFKLQLDNL